MKPTDFQFRLRTLQLEGWLGLTSLSIDPTLQRMFCWRPWRRGEVQRRAHLVGLLESDHLAIQAPWIGGTAA